MNIFWSFAMGIVQGITEFFPVSSSAHLVLIPWMFKFSDPGLAFDIALHAGTLFAIFFALRKDWIKIATALIKKESSFEKKLALFLIITSVPGAIFGYFLEDSAKTTFRNPILIAATLIVFGIILWFFDQHKKQALDMKKMTSLQAFWIGLSQALAIIPGISRSGATITSGRMLGLSREDAAKYSFMAALPIILGATLVGLKDARAAELFSLPWIIGFFASFISSFWAIRFLLRYLKSKSFRLFAIYRLALGSLVILLYLIRL